MPADSAQVQLRNPDAKKKGPRMAKKTYAIVRAAALATLPKSGAGMTLTDFRAAVSRRLARTTGWDKAASASWYSMAIKLDLEARGEIKRVGNAPQRLVRA